MLHTPDPSKVGPRWLNCLIEGESIVFPVTVEHGCEVGDLKEVIQRKRALDTLKDVGPHILELWQPKDPITAMPASTLLERIRSMGDGLSKFAEQLDASDSVFRIFSTQPPREYIHIIVKIPSTAPIRPSNLSMDKPPLWLDEMHQKLWGKRELFGEIFRTAKLTKADFIELQLELQKSDPSRSSPSYTAQNVLDIKANFLRKKSRPMEFDILDSHLLVPSVSPVPDDAMSVDINAEADSELQFDYILDDATELSMGPAAVFPCTIRYMDLTTLKLKDKMRVPHLMLIRDEWDIMIELFNKRDRGLKGSAVFTGSQGIGKTCLLYYILILCLIRSQPVVFQDMHGDVFLITETVIPQTKEVGIEGDDILALVDADLECCSPYKYIFRPHFRILLISSPRPRKDREWLTQRVQDSEAAYTISPWLQEEWLVASLFIAAEDITLRRFWETAHICGFVPRDFLIAVKSPVALEEARSNLSAAITTCHDIKKAINGIAGDLCIPHPAFVEYPDNELRSLISRLIEPVSEYAMDTIMKDLDRRSADAAFNLYKSIEWLPYAATFWSRIWERKVHWYFHRWQIFTIRSLDDNSMQEWDLSKVTVKYLDFGPLQMLAGEHTGRVSAKESIYLQPTSDNFASLDSIVPDSLVGIQITNASTHPITTKGLSALQRSLKPKDKAPTVENPWTLLFVVPKPMENSFVKQDITGADNAGWSKKTKQYVLGLDQLEVFRAQSTH